MNKIGHAMHDLDPVFRQFSRSAKVKELLAALGAKVKIGDSAALAHTEDNHAGRAVYAGNNERTAVSLPVCVPWRRERSYA